MQSSPSPPFSYRDDRVTLRDGRSLAYAEFGHPGGRAVLWFHGTPGGRRQLPPDAPDFARRHGLRIIGIDRPGTGESSYATSRTFASWTRDIEQLADALGLARFAVAGLSGGGPYVLACAHHLPDRVAAGVSLGGVGPINGRERAPGYPALLRWAARAVVPARRPLGAVLSAAAAPVRTRLSTAFDLYARFGARIDRPYLQRPDIKAAFLADLSNATRDGMRGAVQDLALFGQPWEFSLADIQVPIRLWHGAADPVVPLAHGEYLAAQIPGSRLFVMPGIGHFAGFMNVGDVLADLVSVWPERG